ncbi:MAG: thioredoxin family protein [Alphaproteobacteria bacterium]|nr:thioredoxin family protein [Alphaproteobacteria bacterium]
MLKLRKKKIVVLGMAFVDENKNLKDYLRDLTISRDVQDKIEVVQSQELLEFLKHGVVLAPGVIVDGKLKSAGR